MTQEQIVEGSQPKIKPNDAIIMLLDSMNKGDLGRFYKVAEEYRNSLPRGSNTRYRVANVMQQRPVQMKTLDELDSRLKNLLIQGQDVASGVTYLNSETQELIDGLLIEWKNKDLFSFHNIRVRNRILLHGPTGNGKTTIARHIANVSELAFVEVKAESVIDSKLGASASNVFDVLNKINQPCVLFWDEVDSIGCKRKIDNDSSAGHENDRITNSILTNLDRISQDVIFIAATNRYEALDTAFMRRFDVKYEVKQPTCEEKRQFANTMLAHYKVTGLVDAPDNYDGLVSFSSVKDVISALARNYVLDQIHQSQNKINQ